MLGGCGDGTTTAPELPPWERTLPSARVLGERRGLIPTRGIVHLHSPYSYDACDGKPRDATGVVDEACLTSLRTALCTTRIDFAAITDHDGTMADEEFATLFAMRSGDERVMRGADQVASRITCEDGHRVLVTIGAENALMPLMLDRHVAGSAAERHALYDGAAPVSIAAFRDAGALVWVPHTESRTLEHLRQVSPDGLEIYNVHAALDPDIRRDYLGLEPGGAFAAAAQFADTNPGHPEPDLAALAFLVPNRPAIERWHGLLADGRHVAITAGSDAHQNALPVTFGDGERGDSYRRVLRWLDNIVLVPDPTNIAQIEDALRVGSSYALFEVLGTPDGFDVRAVTPTNQTVELGGSVPRATGAMLTVDLPQVRGLSPSLPVPTIRARVIWIEPGGHVEEIATLDATFGRRLDVNLGAPGAYRVEVSIVPSHLGPYLHDLGPQLAEIEYPWIYTSPIYVE